MVEKRIGEKGIRLFIGDITDIETEAFVYDITEDLKLGSGYGGAIAQRGSAVIQEELDAIGSCPTGEAVITSGGKLKAKYIIHVNGPKFNEPDTEDKLIRATKAAIQRAEENNISQLAFPPIGTGLYQVPLALCARVLIETVTNHLKGDTSLKEVSFVALDTREYEPFRARIEGGV